jgi:DnaJ like chaperone protein
MSWFGKLVGGTIGFVLGGPLGAIGGAAIGHFFFDKSQLTEAQRVVTGSEQKQYVFFLTSFSLLGKMAQADGRVSADEEKYFSQLIASQVGGNEQTRQFAMEVFRQSIQSAESFENIASQFYENFRSDYNLLQTMLELLIRMAAADGSIHRSEENLIKKAKALFAISDSDYNRIRNRYIQPSDRYYAVLGLTKSASIEEIKGAYKRMVKEFHPDTAVSQGLPEEYLDFAKKRFIEIQEAYENIAKERNL